MKRSRGKPYRYDNGYHFTDNIKKNVDSAINRVFVKGKASLIIVDGLQGEGKTTLACQIAEYISKQRKTGFDLSKQYARGGVQFQEKLGLAYVNKFPSLVYDEAGDFDRKASITKFNRDLNQVFQQFRTFKIVVVCSLPHFKILDNDLFTNGIPRVLFHCYGRNMNYGKVKIYSLKRINDMIFYLKRKNIPANMVYGKVYANSNGSFKDFEPDMSKQLDDLSTTEKFRFLMSKQNTYTQADMAAKLGRSKPWVGLMLKQTKSKVHLTHKRTNYYDKKVFARLEKAILNGEGLKIDKK